METEDRLAIQQRALEALKKSTKTLEIADQLLRVGNVKEAERLRNEAREQRNVSIWLMAQAKDAEGKDKRSTTGKLHYGPRITEH